MVNPGEKMATASELLGKVLEGSRYNNIQLKDVEELLANEIFTKEMLATTDKGNTLLHLAAMGKIDTVLPLVVQAYKRAKLFPTAMTTLNENSQNPLHKAICHCSYENTVLLLKECRESCPQAMAAMEDGCTLLHMAANCVENVDLVDFFLSPENADLVEPMLLATWTNCDKLPIDVAWNVMWQAEQSLDFAQRHVDQFGKTPLMKQTMQRGTVDPKKKVLDKAKRIHAAVDQATKKAKAKKAKQLLEEMETKKRQEREEQLSVELRDLVQANDWSTVLEKYLFSDNDETQEITVNCLAKDRDSKDSSGTACELPALSVEISRVLTHFLDFPEDQQVVLSSLTLLAQFLEDRDNCQLLLGGEEGMDVVSKVVALLGSLNVAIQHQCSTILVGLTANRNRPDSFAVPDSWIQPLLLIKHFSLDPTAKSLAEQALVNAGSTHLHPDPGCWGVRDVSLWMESNTSLDRRSEYRKSFAEAGIDGLHLLELSVTEMTGLGVKMVYDQRKLSNLVDELRRMNMRSIVGRKDIFMSYAHINIQFGRLIKKALNDGKYSVWIDEAGIRAGQHWRNEIADGIEGCRALVFILTPRSANSVYCQDELAMAKEYKKPIITVKLQAVQEMDPGLKFMIQSRQWIDFSDESQFEAQCGELLKAVSSTIGEPSGIDGEEDQSHTTKHTPEKPAEPQPQPSCDDTDSSSLSLASLQEVVRTELARLGAELKGQMGQLQEQVQRLENKVDQLSQALERT